MMTQPIETIFNPKMVERSTSYHATGIAKSDTTASFHCHDHEEAKKEDDKNRKARRILWISVLICLFFMLCEVAGGYIANSLAIVTDAAHLLTDLASMLISLFSLYIANRPPNQKMSWGFHRAEVLGAFFSVFLIWVVTGVLVVLAIMRIIHGDHKVDAKIMAITASLGVLVNLIMGALLFFGGHSHSHGGGGHGHSHGGAPKKSKKKVHAAESGHGHSHGGHGHSHGGHGHGHSHSHGSENSDKDTESGHSGHGHDGANINVRAAFVHVLGDLIQSIGVLIAALLILFLPKWTILDPICTLFFSVIVLSTTIYILRDALVVLLEGRPSSVNFGEVIGSLQAIPGVNKVHDLRIWALTMDKVAVSVHLEIEDEREAQRILRDTRKMLKTEHNVHECTVQIESYNSEKDECVRCVPLKK
ncbi:unnamed protein product, partial [Mesorhabditis belari]|uniref:Uncharacterized protein n=1 Tax=Mesorhabditis belari TaxID=2138241 RepID=A0AAF3ESB0_9BILA